MELGVVSSVTGNTQTVLAGINRIQDDIALGYALAEFIEPFAQRGDSIRRAQLQSLYADFPIREDLPAHNFYRGLGLNLVQSSVIESFRANQHDYLTTQSVLPAATFYRHVGWETNYLHATENILARNRAKRDSENVLHNEAKANHELDGLLTQGRRWPSITINSVTKTHPMRIREGLGLPKNWAPAPPGATPTERISRHAQQLNAHIQSGNHFTQAPPGSKFGMIQLMARENIKTGAIVD
jgi:hypothetical protein